MNSNPPSLRDLQQGLRTLISKPYASSPLLSFVNETALLSREQRIAIYSKANRLRLQNSLMKLFPAVYRALGKASFHELADVYIQQFPSQSPHLIRFGAQWPHFLGAQDTARHIPWLEDVARFEWLLVDSRHTRADKPMDLGWLLNIPEDEWPRARFQLDPTVKLFRSNWAIDNFWGAREQATLPDVRAYPIWVLMVQGEKKVSVERLSRTQWRFLDRIQAGETLGTITDELQETLLNSQEEGSVLFWFKEWISRGIVRSVEF